MVLLMAKGAWERRATALAVATAFVLTCSVHQIPEGHVGVYYRGGRLLDERTTPGFHLKLPITQVHQVQTTLQTDAVTDIPCGTAGGTVIHFGRIEVVNILSEDAVADVVKRFGVNYDKALIFDKVHHEVNQFCSKHSLADVYIAKFDQVDENIKNALETDLEHLAPGLSIHAVRVTKPRIPSQLEEQYERMEAEKTQALIAQERKRVVIEEAATARRRAEIAAEQEASVLRIQGDASVQQKETERTLSRIEDEIRRARLKANADADFYEAERIAAANQLKLTPAYLELERSRAIASNTKFFFGESIPTLLPAGFVDQDRR